MFLCKYTPSVSRFSLLRTSYSSGVAILIVAHRKNDRLFRLLLLVWGCFRFVRGACVHLCCLFLRLSLGFCLSYRSQTQTMY